jgi:hypothetical protein
MKNLLASILLLSATITLGQTWEITNLDDKFGQPSDNQVIYVNNSESSRDKGQLVYVAHKNQIALIGSYFCSKYDNVTFFVKLPKGEKKFKFEGKRNNSKGALFFTNKKKVKELLALFKSGEVINVKVGNGHCSDEDYIFSLSGFTEMYNKIN